MSGGGLYQRIRFLGIRSETEIAIVIGEGHAVLGIGIAGIACKGIPTMSLCHVHRHSYPKLVATAQIILSQRYPLLCRHAVELRSLCFILRHAAA